MIPLFYSLRRNLKFHQGTLHNRVLECYHMMQSWRCFTQTFKSTSFSFSEILGIKPQVPLLFDLWGCFLFTRCGTKCIVHFQILHLQDHTVSCFLHALGFKKNQNFHTGLVSDTIGYRMLCIQLTCLSDTRVLAYDLNNPFSAIKFLENEFCREV